MLDLILRCVEAGWPVERISSTTRLPVIDVDQAIRQTRRAA